MNSQWRANRIGLIDFWYYDEEEFHFLDGRMLLRGANGSGKSVTMQSFIPLLLDGNMRPERLDPFGSRARKMENYLLEEGDGREERTGYLYMEFKRQEADTYLTLGIGMRARVNKKLDIWYFAITDGRRVGRDFFLYKDVQSKITYTRQELKNRIGDGGKVIDSQKEYANYVNKLLFGFETSGEYKEMLELLIQLRTPKLSKDFKPTVINEILSNSLQTLSEEDLRPMSEAIENMDSLKTNLDSLKESVQAAKQIERVYDQYNRIVLYDKAALYTSASDEYERCKKRADEFGKSIANCNAQLTQEQNHYETLEQEEKVLTEEKKSLDQSDAARLKEQEQSCLAEQTEQEQSVREKSKQREEKRDRRLDIESRIKKQEEHNEASRECIQEHLEEMEVLMEEVAFDEFKFMKRELLANPEEYYDFHAHKQLLQTYMKYVEDGITVLGKERRFQEQYDESLEKLDATQRECDKAEKELNQYETLLHEIKAELTENIYRWERKNEQLKVPDQTMQQISRIVGEFRHGQDYSEIREALRVHFHEKEDAIREACRLECQKEEELRTALKEKKEELAVWEAAKDPEPYEPEAVKKNRRILDEMGIPYLQFYKVVDFEPSLNQEQISRLEEALLEMGILDALIIPADYREQVLGIGQGSCDKYIFSDVSHVKESLLQVLDVDNGQNDIILYQTVSNILNAVGCTRGNGSNDTWIDDQGRYRLGILEGTVTGEYEAKYIGVQARENFRRQQIQILTEACEELENKAGAVHAVFLQKQEHLKCLQQEWRAFPQGDDMKTAAQSYGEKEYEFSLLSQQLERLKTILEQQRNALEEVRMEVQAVCSKTYLKIRLDVFEQAFASLKEYREHLTQIEIVYAKLQNGIANVNDQSEYMEEIDSDIDDILYDLTRAERKLSDVKLMIASIQKQLSLTNYEEIKERLDYCIKRLAVLPKERENSVENSATLRETIKKLRENEFENERIKVEIEKKVRWLCQAFWNEYKLGYVNLEFAVTEDKKDLAKKVCRMLEGQFGNRKQTDLLGSVQEVYHQNRGALLEYNLTMQSLFQEQDAESEITDMSMKRIDIQAKYRGISVGFKELIEKLEIDMENQSRLLNDKDRELFEDILANTISKKIRARIQASKRWVERMNVRMESMKTSSGLKLSLKWKNKRAEKEEQLDTRALVELLQKDVEIMRPEEVERISRHFRSKIEEARRLSGENSSAQSFHMIMKEVLDYRKWFEFQLECQKTGEKKRELTDRVFFTFSGGEKAMAMYVPLFSAVAAKYAGARNDAPRLISLDEAFAGVDEMNIKDMFRLMVEFQFDFMINSQILWGDCETVPNIAIYQLIRPENVKYVTVIPYVWNGVVRNLVKSIGDEIEQS